MEDGMHIFKSKKILVPVVYLYFRGGRFNVLLSNIKISLRVDSASLHGTQVHAACSLLDYINH